MRAAFFPDLAVVLAVVLGGACPAWAQGDAAHRMQDSTIQDSETFEASFNCLKSGDASAAASVTCRSQIGPSMPMFDFLLVRHSEAGGDNVLDRIEIRRGGEEAPFQVVGDVESRTGPEVANNGFELLDLDFDGYLDMRVMSFTPAGPNTPYRNWLWSREDGAFVPNAALDAITAPEFDAASQEIVSRWRSGAAEHGVDVYSYDGSKPVLTHREVNRYDDAGACSRAFYDRINGDLRKTGTGACTDE